MYRYDEFDATIVQERVNQFRGQVARRLAGELTEDQFRPLRLKNGLYLQLHAYMLRIAIPYGMLSSNKLRKLAYIARRYDRGFGHFTTRTNIQFHWPQLNEVPDILQHLAEVEMHAIQTSGNCIRNVTADQFAGVAADEIEDPRIWAEIVRQWSTFHPEFSYLPRKFKIAIIGAPDDRAAIRVHDIGLRIVQNEAGEVGFEVWVGGGLGRIPILAVLCRKFLPKEHLLSYLEAILRTYNLLGRRDNIHKARIKILVQATGGEKFAAMVEEEWEKIKDGPLHLPQAEVERIHRYFAPPAYETLADIDPAFETAKLENPEFARWARTNLVKHKVPGYAIVNVALKPEGATPGDASADQMDLLAELADVFSFGEIRVTHHQNLVLPNVRKRDLYALWQRLKAAKLATSNLGFISDIISCPGLDYCNLANARSIPVAQRLSRHFSDPRKLDEIGELRLNISGCINACGHHHVGHIGILGVDKHGQEFYQVTVGGSSRDDASLGKIVGASFSEDDIVPAIDTIINTYLANRTDRSERFLDYVRRVGVDPFKEALYGPAPARRTAAE
jgi:sulfite reductase (NADPH) hemoprotein beta-component